ncbi:MAG: hypothetical protein WCK86_08580 [Planctomycetia bacterium]
MESEAQTRRNRIDDCLKQAGWHILPWSRGIDITSLRHHALQEYPTANGPADYALVVDGQVMAIVEAKKLSIGPAGVLVQAERYAEGPDPLPPFSEQQEIVRRVEKLFAFTDQIESRLKQAQSHVDRITQSLLVNAFRGELVPTEHALATAEGRNYETATELLARIQTEQNSATVSVKPKRNRVQQSKGSRS